MKSVRPTLEVRDLTISVRLPEGGRATVVDRVSLSLGVGASVGLVGESGSGKTMTSLAIMGLLPPAARVDGGEILLDGENLLGKSPREMQRLRGRQLAMVMQDSLTALDPSFTVLSQLTEPLRQHRGLRGAGLNAAVVEAMEQVQLSARTDRLHQYPHQLSGGMRQRVTSAIALAGRPRLLIADEPTTALDVTTQARYLDLLHQLQEQTGFALILVAHDLFVVRHVCDRVVVMYAGQAVEEGDVADVFGQPQMPYTKALLDAVPAIGSSMELDAIDGQAPDVGHWPAACRFQPRCRFARATCRDVMPSLEPRGAGRSARCWGTEPGGWLEKGL